MLGFILTDIQINYDLFYQIVYPTAETSRQVSKKYRIDTETIILVTVSIIIWVFIIAACMELNRLMNIERDAKGIVLPNSKCTCLNVFDHAVKGSWIRSHDMSDAKSTVITDEELRKGLQLPSKLHRDDLR